MEKVTNKIDKQIIISKVDMFVKSLIKNGEPTGLDLDIGAFMLDYVEEKPAANELIAYTHQLMHVVHSDNGNQTEDILRYFLGRGRGATPSGDDHIIGLLGIHALTDAFHPTFIQSVHNLTDTGSITTKAGMYYLRSALNGEFLPQVARVIHDLGKSNPSDITEHIDQLLPLGHSSGIDTTFGMLLGILTIREKIEQQ